MTRVSIENLIQLLAMIGIIGSLIFVGLEMRQSQIIALAAQSQARASMLLERVGVYTEANLDYQSLTFEIVMILTCRRSRQLKEIHFIKLGFSLRMIMNNTR